MARIRTIKPEFWVSEQVAECSTNARLTFIGLWNFCDDRGVHPAKPKTLKAELYPMDDITAAQVGEWVAELVAVGLVREFEAAGDSGCYWHVTGWDRHQKIDRPSHKHPEPPALNSASTRRTDVAEDSSNHPRGIVEPHPPESKGVESKGMEGESPKARKPTAPKASKTSMPCGFDISERVRAWAAEKGHSDLPQHLEAFKAKCAANGYVYADWDAAFMEAIRGDWAKLREGRPAQSQRRALLDCEDQIQ